MGYICVEGGVDILDQQSVLMWDFDPKRTISSSPSQMLLKLLSSSSRLFVAKDNPEPVVSGNLLEELFHGRKDVKFILNTDQSILKSWRCLMKVGKNLSKNKPIALNGASCVYCHVHVQLP